MSENFFHLFVYGTLRSAVRIPMSGYLQQNAQLIGTGYTPGILYDLGDYPGLVATKDEKNQVFGEIYQICDNIALLHRLDEYEGCSKTQPLPHPYERRNVLITLGEQDIMAWTYFYKGNVIAKKRITGGDYVAYLNASARKDRFIKAR